MHLKGAGDTFRRELKAQQTPQSEQSVICRGCKEDGLQVHKCDQAVRMLSSQRF